MPKHLRFYIISLVCLVSILKADAGNAGSSLTSNAGSSLTSNAGSSLTSNAGSSLTSNAGSPNTPFNPSSVVKFYDKTNLSVDRCFGAVIQNVKKTILVITSFVCGLAISNKLTNMEVVFNKAISSVIPNLEVVKAVRFDEEYNMVVKQTEFLNPNDAKLARTDLWVDISVVVLKSINDASKLPTPLGYQPSVIEISKDTQEVFVYKWDDAGGVVTCKLNRVVLTTCINLKGLYGSRIVNKNHYCLKQSVTSCLTDANKGEPVFNAKGQLVAIVTASHHNDFIAAYPINQEIVNWFNTL